MSIKRILKKIFKKKLSISKRADYSFFSNSGTCPSSGWSTCGGTY